MTYPTYGGGPKTPQTESGRIKEDTNRQHNLKPGETLAQKREREKLEGKR